jgi:hypothetical protein
VFCAPMTMALVIGSLEVLGWAQRAATNSGHSLGHGL